MGKHYPTTLKILLPSERIWTFSYRHRKVFEHVRWGTHMGTVGSKHTTLQDDLSITLLLFFSRTRGTASLFACHLPESFPRSLCSQWDCFNCPSQELPLPRMRARGEKSPPKPLLTTASIQSIINCRAVESHETFSSDGGICSNWVLSTRFSQLYAQAFSYTC